MNWPSNSVKKWNLLCVTHYHHYTVFIDKIHQGFMGILSEQPRPGFPFPCCSLSILTFNQQSNFLEKQPLHTVCPPSLSLCPVLSLRSPPAPTTNDLAEWDFVDWDIYDFCRFASGGGSVEISCCVLGLCVSHWTVFLSGHAACSWWK